MHILHIKSSAPSLTGKSVTHPCPPVWKLSPFCGKTLICQLKTTPFSRSNIDFSAHMKPLFTVKHLTSKLTPFSPNSWRWVPKYPFFLWKSESWIFYKKKRPLYSRILELGCVWYSKGAGIKSFNILVSIALATLAHMINVYEIYRG